MEAIGKFLEAFRWGVAILFMMSQYLLLSQPGQASDRIFYRGAGDAQFLKTEQNCIDQGFESQPFLVKCISEAYKEPGGRYWTLFGYAYCKSCDGGGVKGGYVQLSDNGSNFDSERDCKILAGDYIQVSKSLGISDVYLFCINVKNRERNIGG